MTRSHTASLLILCGNLVTSVCGGFLNVQLTCAYKQRYALRKVTEIREMSTFATQRMRNRRYGRVEDDDFSHYWNDNEDGEENEDEEADLPAHNQMAGHLFEYPLFEDDEDDTWFSMMSPVGSDQFDLDELHERISGIVEGTSSTEVSEQVAEFIQREAMEKMSKKKMPRPKDVHIILFCPDTDYEGVHTIEFPPGSGNNVLLAFECEKECQNFAEILRSQDFFDPSVSDNLQKLFKKKSESYITDWVLFFYCCKAGRNEFRCA